MSTQAYPDYLSFQANLQPYGGMSIGAGMGRAPPPTLPSPMELTQLNQPLLTPYLASAFSIPLSEYGSQDAVGMQPVGMGIDPQNSGGSEGNGYMGTAHPPAQGGGRDGGSSGYGTGYMTSVSRMGATADDEVSRPESGTGQVGFPPGPYSTSNGGMPMGPPMGHPGPNPYGPPHVMPPPPHGIEAGMPPPGMPPPEMPPHGMPYGMPPPGMMGYGPWDNSAMQGMPPQYAPGMYPPQGYRPMGGEFGGHMGAPGKRMGPDDMGQPGGAEQPDQAQALKRPRLVWTAQLHERFEDAISQIGLKNAVPKTIMQLMNVEGLTRENVASHLQKYRLHLKRSSTAEGEGTHGDSGEVGGEAAGAPGEADQQDGNAGSAADNNEEEKEGDQAERNGPLAKGAEEEEVREQGGEQRQRLHGTGASAPREGEGSGGGDEMQQKHEEREENNNSFAATRAGNATAEQ